LISPAGDSAAVAGEGERAGAPLEAGLSPVLITKPTMTVMAITKMTTSAAVTIGCVGRAGEDAATLPTRSRGGAGGRRFDGGGACGGAPDGGATDGGADGGGADGGGGDEGFGALGDAGPDSGAFASSACGVMRPVSSGGHHDSGSMGSGGAAARREEGGGEGSSSG